MAEIKSKRVPPLVWVLAAMLVVIAAWATTHWKGTHQPPSGGPVMAQTQSGGGDPVMPKQPTVNTGPLPPPAPNGAGPTNQPGVQTGPAPNGNPS
jgi:hypothetical protein